MDEQVVYRINDLNFSYHDDSLVLEDIDLDIYKGEFFVFLGVNGSGKTTLLYHLCRLLKPQEGEIKLLEKDISDYTEKELYQLVNMVFQDPNDQLFSTTVEEDVTFGPRNLGLSDEEIESRLQRVLQMVGLKDFRERYIHELSFGEKKRTALAGALAMGSEVLLLDEPTSGIDPVGASEIFRLLRKFNRQEGMTIIMATQDVDMVPLYASRVALLYKGGLEAVGPVKELFSSSELLRRSRIRLPRVAHLMEILDLEHGKGNKPYPLTIGQARQRIMEMISGGFGG